MENLHRIAEYFDSHKLRLVTAESCTAGLVVATLGDVPGCGSWLIGARLTTTANTTAVQPRVNHSRGYRSGNMYKTNSWRCYRRSHRRQAAL